MFHRATTVTFCEGTVLEAAFRDGTVKRFDVADLFSSLPQLEALRDRTLFVQGRLMGGYGIVWTDELDLEVETIYQEGQTIGHVPRALHADVGDALAKARAQCNLSQVQLAASTGIDQSDISKIERGLANPSVSTLKRLAEGMSMQLTVAFVPVQIRPEGEDSNQ